MAINSPQSLEEVIAAKETELETAMRPSDVSALEILLADDLVFTGLTGKLMAKLTI